MAAFVTLTTCITLSPAKFGLEIRCLALMKINGWRPLATNSFMRRSADDVRSLLSRANEHRIARFSRPVTLSGYNEIAFMPPKMGGA